MNWSVVYLPEVRNDLAALDGSQRVRVRKAIQKVAENPLPDNEGGYGRPLGNKHGSDLTGLLKIKLRGAGLRVVYKLVRTETQMQVIVIGAREDDEVYVIAKKRADRHKLL